MTLVRNTAAYLVTYLLLMVPTYVLPYFGSNSAVVNAVSSVLGRGPSPQWWAHVWCLTILVLLAWMRGVSIGKTFLPAFTLIAGFFDMIPGLSLVPLVPTVMHIIGLVMGVMGTVTNQDKEPAGFKVAIVCASVITILALGGSVMFATTAANRIKQNGEGSTQRSEINIHVAPPLSTITSEKIPPTSIAPVVQPNKVQHQMPSAKLRASTPAPAQKVEDKSEVRYIRMDN